MPWAAVTLTTTAVAVAGTPVRVPVTVTGTLVFAATGAPSWRLPRARTGDIELYNPLPLVEGVLV